MRSSHGIGKSTLAVVGVARSRSRVGSAPARVARCSVVAEPSISMPGHLEHQPGLQRVRDVEQRPDAQHQVAARRSAASDARAQRRVGRRARPVALRARGSRPRRGGRCGWPGTRSARATARARTGSRRRGRSSARCLRGAPRGGRPRSRSSSWFTKRYCRSSGVNSAAPSACGRTPSLLFRPELDHARQEQRQRRAAASSRGPTCRARSRSRPSTSREPRSSAHRLPATALVSSAAVPPGLWKIAEASSATRDERAREAERTFADQMVLVRDSPARARSRSARQSASQHAAAESHEHCSATAHRDSSDRPSARPQPGGAAHAARVAVHARLRCACPRDRRTRTPAGAAGNSRASAVDPRQPAAEHDHVGIEHVDHRRERRAPGDRDSGRAPAARAPRRAAARSAISVRRAAPGGSLPA